MARFTAIVSLSIESKESNQQSQIYLIQTEKTITYEYFYIFLTRNKHKKENGAV